jgi:hypothetical protein
MERAFLPRLGCHGAQPRLSARATSAGEIGWGPSFVPTRHGLNHYPPRPNWIMR